MKFIYFSWRDEMLGDLPVWDLSDLYKSHDDKKITSDIKDVKSISKTFIEKYKGKYSAKVEIIGEIEQVTSHGRTTYEMDEKGNQFTN